jgi:uracil-DNA glycosylase
MLVDADMPYALGELTEVERRREMLSMAHVAPLVAYAHRVQAQREECAMPLFDPCDGGVGARVLFLLEAPGPKAVGSTFISRNNPDQTAKNMDSLLKEAGIARGDCLLWNIVPWYIGDGRRIRAVQKRDLAAAIPFLKELLGLLSQLAAVVLVGKHAASAGSTVRALTSVPIYSCPHPSPKVFNVRPEKRIEALATLRRVAEFIACRPNNSLDRTLEG